MKRRNFIRYAGVAGIITATGNQTSGAVTLPTKNGFLREAGQELPVKGNYDVIVCGGGPAGVVAAIEAGRSGARTMLIEANGALGGIWTTGLLTWILNYHFQPGILKEITEELERRGARCPLEIEKRTFAFDPEAMKLLLDEMCLDAGVDIRFHTRVCNAVKENGRLSHIVTESKSGREAWSANMFVDATGDGDLAAQVGCSFDSGDPQNNGITQPFSLLAVVGGIHFEKIKDFTRWAGDERQGSKRRMLKLIQDGGYDPYYKRPVLYPISENLYMMMANHQYEYSGIDADDLTTATINARKEIWKIINAIKKNGGPWENLRLVVTAEKIGVREGRRIHGLYTVSTKDLTEGKQHPDAIANVRFHVDVHSVKKADDKSGKGYNRGIKSKPYTIPLRALIAKDIDGLLLAGRCISGDFIAHSSYRITGPVSVIGQAAAMSVRKNKLPREMKFNEFQFNHI